MSAADEVTLSSRLQSMLELQDGISGEIRFAIKTWDGREDGVWLVEFAADLNEPSATFATEFYNQLSKKYDEVTRGR